MKLEDIEINMSVEVITEEGDDSYEGEVGEVVSISKDLPYPIEVDFGYEPTECFKPEDLEEFD